MGRLVRLPSVWCYDFPVDSDDPLDTKLNEWAKYWPRFLREELASIGVECVRDLLSLNPMDIVCAPKGSKALLGAIISECRDDGVDESTLQDFLARRGRTQPERPTIPFRHPWGCMYVAIPEAFDTSEKAKDFVVQRIV